MSLSPPTRLGPYEITGPLGVGGMGEVYRARDTRIGREVALKVLPASYSTDADRLRRFEQEARAAGALNHPNVLTLHDVGWHDGTPYIVSELLEGETLRPRLSRGPLGVKRALDYSVQMVRGLAAAHDKGIVHRDLKPENVFVTRDERVKILDFGIAKLIAPDEPDEEISQASTTTNATMAGVVVGTAGYMSPEQVEGRPADHRSDLFSFGSILYEMLSGQRAFRGESRVETMSAVLTGEPPPIAEVNPQVPFLLERIVRRCLEKSPENRFQSTRDLAFALEVAEGAAPASAPKAKRGVPRAVGALAVLSIAAAIAASLANGFRPRRSPSSDARAIPVRFSVPPPPGGAFVGDVERTYLALSPDGSQLAFIAAEHGGARRIWLRPVSAIDSRPLSGTEGASSLFWSPDGRSVAFFAGGSLKRLDLPEGAAVPLCDAPEGIGLAGTWGTAGEILFASVEGDAIFAVSTHGGTPAALIKPDRSRGEVRVSWPWFLPDGRRFLYLTRHGDGSGQVTLAERGGTPRPILPAVSNVQWVEPDYLVFVREGILVGQRFDLATERIVGEPLSIAEPVAYYFSTAMAAFTTSRNGNIAYQSHKDMAGLVWSDRNGARIGDVGTPGGYQSLRLSPDGKTLLFDRMGAGLGTHDLWTLDLRRGVETRLTSDPGSEAFGVWLPEGRGVVFMADRGGPPHLFRKNLVTGMEDELRPVGRFQQAEDVSPDGQTLAFGERTAHGNNDVLTLSLSTPGVSSVLLGSRFDESGLRFSPDGQAAAFVSDESGRYEVYVAPFPAMVPKIRVSTGGAARPRWSPAGRGLLYLTDDRHLVSVPVRTAPSLLLGTPTTLFALPEPLTWGDFAVSPDGRFLSVVSNVRGSEQPLTVVLNWPAEIERR